MVHVDRTVAVKLRSLILESILMTSDPSNEVLLSQMQCMGTLEIPITLTESDRQTLLGALLYATESSFCVRQWDSHEQWATMLCEELCGQGDVEMSRYCYT
jgi:hypothetical protein